MRGVLVGLVALALGGFAVAACSSKAQSERGAAKRTAEASSNANATETAVFAGGCFWCMEPPFEKLDGVASVVSGFTGGPEKSPAYDDVARGRTGHVEAVKVTYDPTVVSYDTLLEVFWRQIDPTDAGGQFADRGPHYTTAIFVKNAEERRAAEASKQKIAKRGVFKGKIVTPIREAEPFYPAEEYHQDYYKKNPGHYKRYRRGSGREGFLERTWKGRPLKIVKPKPAGEKAATPVKTNPAKRYSKPSDAELKKRLTPLQYSVTQKDDTERPFKNEYWNEKREGIYVDVVSGEPLFSSKEKFKSGTGWPSFTAPLEPGHIVKKTDYKLGMPRTEVRSKYADSHLGHVFRDGPRPTGLRYCINSAALRFIAKEDLAKEGYGEYAAHFE